MTSIIAIDSSNEDLAGAIVYWRLSNDEHANGEDLNAALRAQGIEDKHLLSLPTPRRALRRAMQDHATGATFLRSGKNGDGGLYLVRQVPGVDGPEFQVFARAHISTGGVPSFEVDDHNIEESLTSRFWHHVESISTTDVSAWLIDQARECDALSMRDTGGIYFIPRESLDKWRRRVDVLHEHTTCRVHLVPAMNAQEALDAIMQSLLDECEAFTTNLDEALAGDLGARALHTRAEQAKTFIGKLDRYAKLLGPVAEGKLDRLREQIAEQQANAVAAALSIEEGE